MESDGRREEQRNLFSKVRDPKGLVADRIHISTPYPCQSACPSHRQQQQAQSPPPSARSRTTLQTSPCSCASSARTARTTPFRPSSRSPTTARLTVRPFLLLLFLLDTPEEVVSRGVKRWSGVLILAFDFASSRPHSALVLPPSLPPSPQRSPSTSKSKATSTLSASALAKHSDFTPRVSKPRRRTRRCSRCCTSTGRLATLLLVRSPSLSPPLLFEFRLCFS